MRDRRVHKRFDVSEYPELVGKTGQSPSGERLLTMSIAGCGFAAFVDEFKFKSGDVIECQFKHANGEWVKVQGAVLYTNPYPLNGQIGRFYGVRFLGDYEKAIKSIVDELESLTVQGKISIAQ